MNVFHHKMLALAIAAAFVFTTGFLSSSDAQIIDCPSSFDVCIYCDSPGFEVGVQFGTCSLGPGSIIIEPADNCYGFQRPLGFCFNPEAPCDTAFICCAGGTIGYWVCNQWVFETLECFRPLLCSAVCCANNPTPQIVIKTCEDGAQYTQVRFVCF